MEAGVVAAGQGGALTARTNENVPSCSPPCNTAQHCPDKTTTAAKHKHGVTESTQVNHTETNLPTDSRSTQVPAQKMEEEVKKANDQAANYTVPAGNSSSTGTFPSKNSIGMVKNSFNIPIARDSQDRFMKSVMFSNVSPPGNTIVTPQGTWQNVAASSAPQQTLPAVQNFLQMAFETVQRSTNNTLPTIPSSSAPQAGRAMLNHSLPTKGDPQTLHSSFQSLQQVQAIHPHPNTVKPQTTSEKSGQMKQTGASASESEQEQSPSTSDVKKTTGQTGTARSYSYPQYTFYNSAIQSSTRPVLVAARHNHVVKALSDPGTAPQTPPSELLLQNLKPKVQTTSSAETASAEQSPKRNLVKPNSSRVAQTYKELKERDANGAAGAQARGGRQGGEAPRSWRRAKHIDETEEEIDPKRRVLVSGFPAYTQSQDLIRVMSKFGYCQVDSCRNRLAVLTFKSEAEATKALLSPDDVNIYGEFVEIKRYTNSKHVDALYREYKKVIQTQKVQDITLPDQIDLTGDFYQQLENIENAIRLTREQVQAVTNLYRDLEMVLQTEWPGCVAVPFGSIPTGLGTTSSDADCFVSLGACAGARGAAAFVARARRALAAHPAVFAGLVPIPRANTPILKFRHVPTGFHCDVSAKTPLGAQNSKLIKHLLDHDARLVHVALALKYWARVHELSGTGRLSNYALTMMAVFYFQQPAVGLLPAVERLQRDPSSRYIVDNWNAGFSARKLAGSNAAPLPDLLGGFFEFYAGFDFDKSVVCPFLGTAVPKAAFGALGALPPELARYAANVRDNLVGPLRTNTAFCVQDPFEQSHNVASAVGFKLAGEIRSYLRFAADAWAAERAAPLPAGRLALHRAPDPRRRDLRADSEDSADAGRGAPEGGPPRRPAREGGEGEVLGHGDEGRVAAAARPARAARRAGGGAGGAAGGRHGRAAGRRAAARLRAGAVVPRGAARLQPALPDGGRRPGRLPAVRHLPAHHRPRLVPRATRAAPGARAGTRPRVCPRPRAGTRPRVRPRAGTRPRVRVSTRARPCVGTRVRPRVDTRVRPRVGTRVRPRVGTRARPCVGTRARARRRLRRRAGGGAAAPGLGPGRSRARLGGRHPRLGHRQLGQLEEREPHRGLVM